MTGMDKNKENQDHSNYDDGIFYVKPYLHFSFCFCDLALGCVNLLCRKVFPFENNSPSGYRVNL